MIPMIPALTINDRPHPMMWFKETRSHWNHRAFIVNYIRSPAEMIETALRFHLPAFECFRKPPMILPERCQGDPTPAADHPKSILRRPATPQDRIEYWTPEAQLHSAVPYRPALSWISRNDYEHAIEHFRSSPPGWAMYELIDEDPAPLPVSRRTQTKDSHEKKIPRPRRCRQ